MNFQPDLTDVDLNRLVEAKIVAVDCEMGGLNPYRDSLYLVQLCDPNGTVNFIKTRNWLSATNLKELFASTDVKKVFHFAIMDCGFILNHCKVLIQNPYCTKIASKLARTNSNTHSLRAILEDLLRVTPDKTLQTSFWGWDEITKEQLEYAANDVRYLLTIRQRLEEILTVKGMLPTGISYIDMNTLCQGFIPSLVHLWVSGWDFGKEDPNSIFGK
jgi:ribonuclease D